MTKDDSKEVIKHLITGVVGHVTNCNQDKHNNEYSAFSVLALVQLGYFCILFILAFNLGSLALIMRFMVANFLVLLARAMMIIHLKDKNSQYFKVLANLDSNCKTRYVRFFFIFSISIQFR